MAYTKTNWQDLPNTTTPITATRLNNMESGIENNDKRLNGTIPAGEMIVDSIRSKNMFDTNQLINGNIRTSDGVYEYRDYIITTNFIKVKANTTYTIKLNNVNDNQYLFSIVLFNSNKTYNSAILVDNTFITEASFTPTIGGYIRINFGKNNWSTLSPNDIAKSNPQLEEGSEATNYMPYQNLDGMETYSNGETLIGTFLGKPLYRKVIEFTVNDTSQMTISHGISGLSWVTKCDISIYNQYGFYMASSKDLIDVNFDSNYIYFTSGWPTGSAKIIMEYTK